MKYDLLSQTAPELPSRLPNFVKLAISKVPNYMRPAAANALFPPIAAQMHDVFFRYWDNVRHEPSFMECCIAPSGVGKGYLDDMIESLIRFLRDHDRESERKLIEWQRKFKTKGQNQNRPERPTDAATLIPHTDMTNPALIQLLMDAEHEGNRSLYSAIPEIDLLDQSCGGHRNVTRVIRLNFDTKRYGAQRASAEGITGSPFLRWKFNISCNEERAQSFFKHNLTDGTLGRIGMTYIQRPMGKKRSRPRQGDYDKEFFNMVDKYLVRLRSATGEIKVPCIDRLILRLSDELDDIAELADDDDFESLAHRSLVMAWRKGCVLYVAEGYKWSKEIAAFVEWSVYNDLWSKGAVFSSLIKKKGRVEEVDVRKHGPVNMLDLLPDSFSQVQLEEMRLSRGMKTYCARQLFNWVNRGHVTFDPATELYHKTDEYLAKHR